MTSWQENLTSTSTRLSHIFKTGDISDVIFIVGGKEGQKAFKLHKLILSTCSDVFFAMFYGSLPEKEEVRVPDIQPDIFQIAMKYVYEDSFSVQSVEQAMFTYSVAEKYNIAHLRKLCSDYMTENLCPESIPVLYRMPNILEVSKIRYRCQKLLSENATDILESNYFLKYPLNLVKDMIQLDDLDVESEAKLFEFVVNWAKSSSTMQNVDNPKNVLRTVMENFLPHIRFLAMSVEEFLSGPANRGILTVAEVNSISENLAVPGCQELPSWCDERRLRCVMHSFQLMENHVCKLDCFTSNSLFCSIYVRRGSIILRGFSLYLSPNDSLSFLTKDLSSPSLSLSIIRNDQETFVNQTMLSYDPKKLKLICTLLDPFYLKPVPNNYIISVTIHNFFLNFCQFSRCGSYIRTFQDFELEWCDLTCYYERPSLLSGKYCFPHFHEIFYS